MLMCNYRISQRNCIKAERGFHLEKSKGKKMLRAEWDVLVNYGIAVPKSDLTKIYNNFIVYISSIIKNLFRNRGLRITRNLLLLPLLFLIANLDFSEGDEPDG